MTDYLLLIVAMVISSFASLKVKSTYQKYATVRSMSGMTGAEAADRILRSQGIYDVSIEQVAGSLTDHYDPRAKVLRLSQSVYANTSVAAIGVAAHECGHAVQHNVGYFPLNFRSALVPVANIGSQLSWPLILLGLFIGGTTSNILINLGILLFCCAVLFQLVTLPVEFNASRRALILLEKNGILGSREVKDAKNVLSAAAMTYVAAAAGSMLQLLRLILIARRNND